MKKYLIDIETKKVNNAGFKLRSDFNYFAEQLGYIPLKVFFPRPKNILLKLSLMNLSAFMIFVKYIFLFKNGDQILIQYPLNFKYLKSFCYIRKFIAIRIGILINDLDSLRHKSNINYEFEMMRNLDFVITPNNKMNLYLKNNNIKVPIINIEMYDYKVQEWEKMKISTVSKLTNAYKTIVVFAGNLKKNKSGFIYHLNDIACDNVLFHLYGDNYQEVEENLPGIEHMGTFEPDNISNLKGDYGLVWDGPDTSTCSGNYGSYLKLNNPHKTSLYLTAGLPVITWNQSAISDFILSNNVGLCLEDLKDLPFILNNISDKEYQKMKENALQIGVKLRNGNYLKNALRASEELFQ